MLNHTQVFPAVPATLTGQSIISHAGLNVLTSFLDATGFGAMCEEQLSGFVPESATHRPGRIFGSLAVMLADGGEHVSELDTLRDSPDLFGSVGSNATVSRFVKRASQEPEAFTLGFGAMTKALRSKIWEAAGPRNPAVLATRLDPLIIDLDATLVNSHSEKEWAAGDYKGGFGHAPFVASADYGKSNGTGEVLVAELRAGNKGASSAADHIPVLGKALDQLPDSMRDEHGNLHTERILVRTDSAGASREFLNHLHELGLQFSTSYTLPVPNERYVHWINNKDLWERVIEQDGYERYDAWVIDATKVIPLHRYPAGTRLYLRAEPLHPGAQASISDVDGHRVTAFLTNAPRYFRRVPRRPAPRPGKVRKPHQDTQKQRHGKAAVLRYFIEPTVDGLGCARDEPRGLDALGDPARRPRRRGLRYETVALPAVLDRRENRQQWPKEEIADPPGRSRITTFDHASGRNRPTARTLAAREPRGITNLAAKSPFETKEHPFREDGTRRPQASDMVVPGVPRNTAGHRIRENHGFSDPPTPHEKSGLAAIRFT